MYIAGIIAEYNPLHNGHLYHLEQTKTRTSPELIIVVMSGSFVQRGMPAIVDKWTRTRMALKAGADLVIELPTLYSCSSANGFAYGSILTLIAAQADCFVCGAEHNDLNILQAIAKVSYEESKDYRTVLHRYLDTGYSFAKAQALAITQLIPAAEPVLAGSNNILAINYLKAILQLKSTIKPILIERIGPAYNSTSFTEGFASATAIRKVLPNLHEVKQFMPEFSYNLLHEAQNNGRAPITLNRYSDLILGLLRRSDVQQLKKYPEMEKGMPELFINNARKFSILSDFIANCTSKRYPSSRIRRMLVRIVLRADSDIYNTALTLNDAPYLRILGLNKNKSALIKKWRSRLNCFFIQRPAKFTPANEATRKLWELDLRATDIYSLLLNNEKLSCHRQDFSHPFIAI